MKNQDHFLIEDFTPFNESQIWALNRKYYEDVGMKAWSTGVVPHHMTSNSMVGKTYAELIFASLKDIGNKTNLTETIYILELGAGHGRLAFHTVKHLDRLISEYHLDLPNYCYVISDIGQSNLDFFSDHPQLQQYFTEGKMDVAYFDALESDEIKLIKSGICINQYELNQPLIALGNYFFDSLPNDLFYIKDGKVYSSLIKLSSTVDPTNLIIEKKMDFLDVEFQNQEISFPIYSDDVCNQILKNYSATIKESYIFFPYQSMMCINRLNQLSNGGVIMIAMDKGFHELHEIDQRPKPEIIVHGSFSLWVNFHALKEFCKLKGGETLMPKYTNFYLQLGCLIVNKHPKQFNHLFASYNKFVNEFGPDDFNGIKRLAYKNVNNLNIKELIALLRLSNYDSTFFIELLPKFRKEIKQISFTERHRIEQTVQSIWDMYFSINEPKDLAYEIAGLLYELGFYQKALLFYGHSNNEFGLKAEVYYNQILCYYQLRQDELFSQSLKEAKINFPSNLLWIELDKLDLDAE